MRTPLLSGPFGSLFAVQALNAFNDNLFKNALVVFVVFRATEGGAVLVALSGGIFLLPYLLVSASAGQLADKMDKSRLILWTQVAAVLLMVAAAAALWLESIPALLLVLFGLGVHAAVFGPLKYGSIPELLAPEQVLRGNALVEAATFAAILLGTVAGGLLVGLPNGTAITGAVGLGVALAGLAAAAAIPRRSAADPALRLRGNVLAETAALLRAARANRPVWISVMGLSWFWGLGATFLAQFPVLAQEEFRADNRVVTLLLFAFALGVGLGSLAAGRRAGRPGTVPGAVPRAAVLLSVFTAGFALLCRVPTAAAWSSPGAMLTAPAGLLAFLCLLGASAAGGLYSVPLYATLQQAAEPASRARMVAANNVVNAIFIVVGAVVIAILAALGWRPWAVLAAASLLNLVAASLLSRALRATVPA